METNVFMKTKICSKCGDKYPATLEHFLLYEKMKSKLSSWCKYCHQNYDKEIAIIKHLRCVFHNMNHRCNNSNDIGYKYYGGRGIQNKFKLFDNFKNYVINELQIDPRGLDCDRIENNGHYEKGNIRFVTRKENLNNRRNSMRHITEDEERCYRLRHHNFKGLTTKETAKIMKIAPEKVRLLLKSLRAKAPQLFPIFTYRQWLVYWLYTKQGLPMYKIATYLNTAYSNVWGLLNKAKKKSMPFLEPCGFGDTVAYEDGMDNYIIHKF